MKCKRGLQIKKNPLLLLHDPVPDFSNFKKTFTTASSIQSVFQGTKIRGVAILILYCRNVEFGEGKNTLWDCFSGTLTEEGNKAAKMLRK